VPVGVKEKNKHARKRKGPANRRMLRSVRPTRRDFYCRRSARLKNTVPPYVDKRRRSGLIGIGAYGQQ